MYLAYLSLLFAAQPLIRKPPPIIVQPMTKADTAAASDEQILKAAHLSADGPALIDFFHKRSAPTPDKAHLDALIARFADKTPETADKACGEIVSIGSNAVPALRPFANNPDGGATTVRARKCLQLIEGSQGAALTATAVRLLAVYKPEGGVAALLGFLPFAEDYNVSQEIEASLTAIALRDGKPDPALIKALADKDPVRRAVAAGVLCQVGGRAIHAVVRPLLKDPKPTVRLKVTLALVEANDAEAVPVLIDLLSDLPLEQRKQAEDSLAQLAGEWTITTPQGNDATSRRLRREMWHAWWRDTDGAGLLDEFRSRTLSEADRVAVLDLIAKLGDASAEVRKKAEAELLALGPKVVPLLRRSVNLGGAKGHEALVKCLHQIETNSPALMPNAAPRLLALRRPPAAIETMLAYLPFAENSELSQQTRDLIASIAPEDPRSIPVLVKALKDPTAVRRAAAAEALCKTADAEQLAAIRKLLADPDSEVRLRAALGLAARKQKEAVPVLVALLADLPIDSAYEVEDYLLHVAGDKAPSAPLTNDGAVRAKARDAWAAWWKTNADTADLARGNTGDRMLGFQLVVEAYDNVRRSGRVLEVDRAGKTRWEVTGLQYPIYAESLPGDRVLIVEQNLNRVSERDHKGKVIWEKQLNQPFHVQRLRNGHTFIACRQLLLELDRDGKEVMSVPRINESILAATKLRDGQIAFVTYQSQYFRLDANGKEVKSLRLPFINNGVWGDVLPNDRVIISSQGLSKVTEYDGNGKVVWETNVPQPGIPARQANGHTLVPAQGNAFLVELDRTGKIVHEFKNLGYRPWRVTRR